MISRPCRFAQETATNNDVICEIFATPFIALQINLREFDKRCSYAHPYYRNWTSAGHWPLTGLTSMIDFKPENHRLLTLKEAAKYVRVSENKFRSECPVRPVEIFKGTFRYDEKDLDQWI